MIRRLAPYLAILVVAVVANVWYMYWKYNYIGSEGQSRHSCRSGLGIIGTALLLYADAHDGRMPSDLYGLVSERYLDRAELVCPGSMKSALKAGFLADNSPVFISSFRLLVPRSEFAEIPDGTVLVREFDGNHPYTLNGECIYPAGYHVIIKDHNHFSLDFITSSSQPTVMGDD
ncbi:MAG TPA: hypothetical protein VMX13_00515 [Sedimentisphaerales bacterium]|nr:hypothetical protein [Sedimentisphaerales bacterium]